MSHRIALIYASLEGQTRKIAERLRDFLVRFGAVVELHSVTLLPESWSPAEVDAVILASPVHQAEYHPAIKALIGKHLAALNAMPSALVSVCMNVALGEHADTPPETYSAALTAATGWHPGRVEHVAGALRYSDYNWAMRVVMRNIAKTVGLSTDLEHDAEYTDWTALERFAQDLLAELGG